MQIAREEGLFGPHLQLFAAIGRVHPQVLGKTLPLNGAGVCGAALADLGLPLPLLRGFALLARTAGLIGQLAEELRHPVANDDLPVGGPAQPLGRPRPVDLGDLMRAALIETPRLARGARRAPRADPRRGGGAGRGVRGADRPAGPPVRLGHLLLRGAVDAVRARRAGRRARAGGTGRPGEGHTGLVRDDRGHAAGRRQHAGGRRGPRVRRRRARRRARTRSWSPRSDSRPWRPGWR